MTDRQQSYDHGMRKSRRTSSQRAKGYWIALVAAGFVSAQLSPAFARNAFNSPVVPLPASPRVSPPHTSRHSAPTRFSDRGHRSHYVPAPSYRSSRSRHYREPSRRSFYPSRRSYSVDRRFRPRHRVSRGRVFATLPLGYAALTLSNDLYYYHSGDFYRRAPGGYMVVDAPVGAVVPTLPAGYSFLVVDGVRYCTYDGYYYLPVSDGYRVVADPRGTTVQPVLSSQVAVTSDRLNVRSGPGLGYAQITTVYRGNILQVLRITDEWLYVQLPDGRSGWVMMRFTAPVPAGYRADG